jgi:hypothetical protein
MELAGLQPADSRRDEIAWRTGFVLLAAVVFGLYLLDPPNVPDLAAQTARAEAAKDGAYLWWTGWFGGLTLPSYSVGSPWVMAHVGVGLSAALSGLVACAAAPILFEGTRRPRAGAAIFGLGVFLNVLTGRVTFSLGFAAAVLALVFLRRRQTWGTVAAATVACLFSPLAGLWLGLIAVTVAIVDGSRRRSALVLSGVLVAVAGVLAVVFVNPGTMSFPWWHVTLALVAAGAVARVCPSREVRVGAAMFAIAIVAFALVPTAVGTNMMRLVWLTAGPAIVATATLPALPKLGLRRAGIAVLGLGALSWPVTDLTVQLAQAASPQASRSYYASLVDELQRRSATAGPAAMGQRVEIVDPASHWSAAYVAPTVPIARGWDRQADRAANPFFYDGTLSATNYRVFLSELAVRWVALPTEGSLDYAAKAEADLIRTGLPYLRPVWADESWQLFQVQQTRPLLAGATLLEIDASDITFQATQAGPVQLQIRWSPLLTLTQSGSGEAVGCVIERGDWTTILVPEPGTYTLVSRLARPGADRDPICD